MPASLASLLLILFAYLIGSLSGSLLLGRARGVNMRTLCSGNAGGSNAFRSQGWRFSLGVVVLDVRKGALATWFALLAALTHRGNLQRLRSGSELRFERARIWRLRT